MAKKKNMLFDWVAWIVVIVVSVGIGGLFINGTFMDVIILNWLPSIVHQVVGWLIIGTTIVGAFMKLFK